MVLFRYFFSSGYFLLRILSLIRIFRYLCCLIESKRGALIRRPICLTQNSKSSNLFNIALYLSLMTSFARSTSSSVPTN